MLIPSDIAHMVNFMSGLELENTLYPTYQINPG